MLIMVVKMKVMKSVTMCDGVHDDVCDDVSDDERERVQSSREITRAESYLSWAECPVSYIPVALSITAQFSQIYW